MGIKNFSKVFNATRIIKWKDYAGKTVAIDAMTELYRAALGASSVNTLTDSSGKPTAHINTILATILEIHRSGVNQIWVFDHNQNPDEDFHNPAKLGELLKRKKKKEEAASEMKTLKDFQQMSQNPTFSDDEEEDHETPNTTDKPSQITGTVDADVSQRIAALEKRTFSATPEMIADVKLILGCLNIHYLEAPAGCEGEQTATHLTNIGKADAVYSGDTDPIAYGVTCLLRRNPKDKKIYEYPLEDIIKQVNENSSIENPTIEDVRKAAVALGTDLAEKSPGIGAKTVLKKLHTIKLSKKQTEAMSEFAAVCDESKLVIYNENKVPFAPDCMKTELIDWLVNVKSFNKTRIIAMFEKKAAAKKTISTKKVPAKTTPAVKKPLPAKRVGGKVVKATEPEPADDESE